MTTRDQTLFKTHMPSFTSQEKGNINTENTAKKIFNSSLFHESNGNCDRSEPVLHRKLFFNRTNKQRVRDPTRAITDLPLGSYLRHHVSLGRKNCQIPLTLRHDTEICKSSEEFCHVDRSQTLPRARSDFQRSAIVKLRNFTNDGMEAILANEITATDEDLTVFESQLAGQFKRLLSAIDGVSKQMQIAFEGLHESVDDLQASLDVEYTFGWRKHSDHLHRARVKQTSCISRDICVQQRTHRWETLEEAMEMVRDSIRHLTESLITEKEDALLGGNYHDKQMILTKMMHPYLEKPSFEKTSHTKYGLNRCIASVLFKASNVLARSQNVMGSFSGSKSNVKDSDEVLFKRFCKKGQKGLEAIAKMDESKWSVQLKNLFFNACKSTWQLQTLRVARMSSHQIEFLWPEAGSRLDEASMDPLDSLSEGHFQPIVQFTVFPGLKVEQSILIKAQVYLHPSYPFMMST
ncbi:hypothetical protein KP509_18G075400 [Ceratopteris richardii]|nr:hypothetical protein KP509_18G075400 [Ceratopteris richardii]